MHTSTTITIITTTIIMRTMTILTVTRAMMWVASC